MSVEVNRVLPRIAGCCLLALFVAAFAPPAIPADEFASPYFDDAEEPEGMLCMDDMETQPYSDDLEPLPASHVDSGCSVSQLPISV